MRARWTSEAGTSAGRWERIGARAIAARWAGVVLGVLGSSAPGGRGVDDDAEQQGGHPDRGLHGVGRSDVARHR